MQHLCSNCGSWCYLDDGEQVCITCSRREVANLKPKILSKVEEEHLEKLRGFIEEGSTESEGLDKLGLGILKDQQYRRRKSVMQK